MILPVRTDTRTLSPSSVYFHSTSVGFLKDRQQREWVDLRLNRLKVVHVPALTHTRTLSRIHAGHGPEFSLPSQNLLSKFGDLKFFNHADSKILLKF